MGDDLAMIAEQVDAVGIRFDRNIDGPGSLVGVMGHLQGVFVRNEFLQVTWTAVVAAIVDPPDSTGLFAGVGGKSNGDVKEVSVDLSFDGGWGQKRAGGLVRKEMAQEKGSFVLLIAFDERMPLSAVASVGTEVDRDGGMMGPTPGEIIGDHVMRAGVKEDLDAAGSQGLQVAGDKNLVGDIAGKGLKVFPGMAGIEGALIKVGAKVPAGESALLAAIGKVLIPGIAVAEAERRIPNR